MVRVLATEFIQLMALKKQKSDIEEVVGEGGGVLVQKQICIDCQAELYGNNQVCGHFLLQFIDSLKI